MKPAEVIRRIQDSIGILLNQSKLGHWERYGLVGEVERSERHHRRYSDEDVKAFEQITVLRELGFTTNEIKLCLEGDGALRSLVFEKLKTYEEKVIPYGKAMVGEWNSKQEEEGVI